MKKRETSRYQTTLVIDTTERDSTKIALIHDREIVTLVRPLRAQHLQEMMTELLENVGLASKEVEAIAVLTGPGSFTGIRIGATAANTWRFLHNTPLIPIESSDFEEAISQITKGKIDRVATAILPQY